MKLSNLFRSLGAIGIGGLVLGLAAIGDAYAAGPGAEVCKGCHTAYFESYASSIHGQKGNTKGPAGAGECSSCHGDGTEHVSKGGGRGVGGIKNPNSKAISAEEKSAACLNCHQTSRSLAFWDSGTHRKNDVSCNSCHSIHSSTAGNNTKMLKGGGPTVSPYVTTVRALEYETCNNCHRDVRTQLLKPSHHPIVEGKVKCSDCHNPHGTLSTTAMIKNDSVVDLCTSCHTDKRGPYIWEHPPVSENCLTCHVQHGSNHNKLLATSMPNLCQDCHNSTSHLSTIWNRKDTFVAGGGAGTPLAALGTSGTTISANSPREITRSCVNCHTAIHGSNSPGSSPGQHLRR